MYGKAQFVIYLLYRNSGRSRMFYYNFFLASDSAFCNCFCCIGYIVLLCASASCRLCTSCHNYYYYIRLYWLRLIRLAQYPVIIISIHAPRVRCDKEFQTFFTYLTISIHAPRVRCDTLNNFLFVRYVYFNPRTSCEVRLNRFLFSVVTDKFQSTHLV